jgi:hypothetical protein
VTSVQHDAVPRLSKEESIAGLSAAVAVEGSNGVELTETATVHLEKASCEYTPNNTTAGYSYEIRFYMCSHSCER